VLDSRQRDLVPLADELAFLRRYHRLLELRFGPRCRCVGAALAGRRPRWLIAPLALQGLLENAVKHNQASAAEPAAGAPEPGRRHVACATPCGRGAARCRRPAWAWPTSTSAAGCSPAGRCTRAQRDGRSRSGAAGGGMMRPMTAARLHRRRRAAGARAAAGALARVAPQVQVVGHADSVRGTQAWLAAHPAPDLLLLDIQLSRRAVARAVRRRPPGAADDLHHRLRPLRDRRLPGAGGRLPAQAGGRPALVQALQKVERLRRSFGTDVAALLRSCVPAHRPGGSAWWGRKGAQFHALPVEQLAYVVSVDKLAFAVDAAGERYLLETPLAELEAALDPRRFFRANRQLLVSVRQPSHRQRLATGQAGQDAPFGHRHAGLARHPVEFGRDQVAGLRQQRGQVAVDEAFSAGHLMLLLLTYANAWG
jgi:hypothetical protein